MIPSGMEAVLDSAKASLQRALWQWSGAERLLEAGRNLPGGEGRDVADTRRFLAAALSSLGVGTHFRGSGVADIPSSGSLVVVANHPYGGLEGLAVLEWLLRFRGDVKVLANDWLAQLPGLRPCLLGVDVFADCGPAAASQRNSRVLREATRWLEAGGVLLVFPAGEVAHLRTLPMPIGAVVLDSPWRLGVAYLLRRIPAMVLPLWIEGANSGLFQAAGLVHPLLRTVLLPRELRARAGRQVVVHCGEILAPDRLPRGQDPQALVDFLRLRAALAMCKETEGRGVKSADGAGNDRRVPAAPMAVIAPEDPADVAREWAAIPAADRLVETGRFAVCRLRGSGFPSILRELGRLREETFRAVGEGTGRALDVDGFDGHYTHLVLRDLVSGSIAGAYRLSGVDEAVATGGRGGCYTTTLFRFREPALALLGRATELGRSFIALPYQRQHLPLLLLWRAVALHVMAQPGRHCLFGPASISASMSPRAIGLILEWLRLHRSDPLLGALVIGRAPVRTAVWPRNLRAELRGCRDVDALDRLVLALDPRSGGLPPLLRHYLRLGARFVAANRDAAFADAIDVLVTVDLRRVPERTLARLVGEQAARVWLQANGDHGVTAKFRHATKLSQSIRINDGDGRSAPAVGGRRDNEFQSIPGDPK